MIRNTRLDNRHISVSWDANSSSLEVPINSTWPKGIIILRQSFLNREISTFNNFCNTLGDEESPKKDIENQTDCLSIEILHIYESLSPMELQNKRPLGLFCTLHKSPGISNSFSRKSTSILKLT